MAKATHQTVDTASNRCAGGLSRRRKASWFERRCSRQHAREILVPAVQTQCLNDLSLPEQQSTASTVKIAYRPDDAYSRKPLTAAERRVLWTSGSRSADNLIEAYGREQLMGVDNMDDAPSRTAAALGNPESTHATPLDENLSMSAPLPDIRPQRSGALSA
ncbi:hypothetical protein [Burkholderia aenigmatica]|uniref:hypothetical protein n=1 Tax=Burkholderia aenigmatica TaxID=2015348 RepID=UPI002652127F|nr:hypothetical protein [Burkholderia aenigmatica]MDN7880444.1 hypothetical protein [Burkholderia aenigmatica]